jgi:hypothetical protein
MGKQTFILTNLLRKFLCLIIGNSITFLMELHCDDIIYNKVILTADCIKNNALSFKSYDRVPCFFQRRSIFLQYLKNKCVYAMFNTAHSSM